MRLHRRPLMTRSHSAIAAVTVSLLLMVGLPSMAAAAPPSPSEPSSSASAVDGQQAAKEKAAGSDGTGEDDATGKPSASASASPTPTPTPTVEPTDQPTASPSSGRSADDSPAPGDPGKSATPEPTTSKAPSATPEPQDQTPPKASKAEVSALLVPPATGNNAVITVKVGGNRTSLTAVGNLAGVTLGFYAAPTGGTPLFTCVSDTDGDCSITVPNTQPAGANRDHRFWVRQISTASGYYTNPELGTGETVATDPYRFQTGTQLRAGTTYRSTVDFMISTGTSNNEASGGIWQNSRNNPTFPAKCGINVALVLDLSNSVTDAQLVQLKAAANGFVDALTGTPSQVGTFTFATSAPANTGDTLPLTPVSTPAGGTVVKNRISGYRKPGGNGGGTNWDRGIYQVAQSTSTFDVAVVITDGNPTFYAAGEGPGNRTRFREVENGIFSANAIKAKNTKVIAFGVGDGIGNSGSGDNLRSISGPTLNSDYYQTTDYQDAGDQLRELALGNCTGSITVVKQVVPATAPPGSTTGATPAGGWTFAGTGSADVSFDAPTSRVTAAGTGAANFPLTFTGGATTGPVTLTETQQAGYTLQQVGGFNAVCTRVDTGASVPVTNSGATGFTVDAANTFPVSCTVYNRTPNPSAQVVLNKTWVVNGITYAEGTQPPGLVAAGTIDGTNQPWGVPRAGFTAGDSVALNESLSTPPTQCTLDSSRLTSANGTTVDLALPSNQTLASGLNTYGITNVLTCPTKLTLTKAVRFGDAAPTLWTLDAVAPAGAAPGPNGISGSAGATAPVTPAVTYPLAESGGPLQYAQVVDPNANLIPGSTGSWNCVEVAKDGTTEIPGFADGLNGGVTVPFGTWVRCTAINDIGAAHPGQGGRQRQRRHRRAQRLGSDRRPNRHLPTRAAGRDPSRCSPRRCRAVHRPTRGRL